jgi:hypothetical protein
MYLPLGLAGILALISSLGFVSAQCGTHACLAGYLWREAIPSDHVCVTRAVRSQTAADNTAAASRIQPNGASGPATCKAGYVWREAYTNDQVCVTPATRSEAAADNAAAGDRVASLLIYESSWDPAGSELAHISIDGRQFNFGLVRVAIFNRAGVRVTDWATPTSSQVPGYVGGTWDWDFSLSYCSPSELGQAKESPGYALAQDLTSGCYSAKLNIVYCLVP